MQEQEQSIIYWHPHPNHDRVKHATELHKERNINTFNRKFAVFLTKNVGSMWAAYSFVVLALVGLASILGYLQPIVVLLVTWLSQTFIQLVLLPVIMVGQNVLNEHNEAQADVTYENTKEALEQEKHSIEHLNAQDKELLYQTQVLKEIQERLQTAIQYLSHEINDLKMQQQKMLEELAKNNTIELNEEDVKPPQRRRRPSFSVKVHDNDQ